MKIKKYRKITSLILLLFFAVFFADKIIPHSHHHDGLGVVIDFSSEQSQHDPIEDEEAGEKIHSEFYTISELINYSSFNKSTIVKLSFIDLDNNFRLPDIPIFIQERYYLLEKIININHVVIKYCTYKAPPTKDILKIKSINQNNQNIYWRSNNERCTRIEIALV